MTKIPSEGKNCLSAAGYPKEAQAPCCLLILPHGQMLCTGPDAWASNEGASSCSTHLPGQTFMPAHKLVTSQ